MRRLRGPGSVALGLLLVTGLAGCASETEQYCDELKEQEDTFAELATSLSEGDEDALDQTLEVLRDLQDQAPGDIREEWDSLVFAYEGLVEAFEAAGTSPGEYDPTSPPKGVNDAEADRIEDAAAELRSRRLVMAAEGIQRQAKDVCRVDLGAGAGSG